MITFSDEQVRYARGMVRYFSSEWFGERPLKLHTSRSFDDSGSPAFTAEFVAYLDAALRDKRNGDRPRGPNSVQSDPRRRVTSAFRTLRQRAPREYDAMNCLTVIDQVGRHVHPNDQQYAEAFESALAATAIRFNERAERLGKEERYTANDILILVISAVDKLARWAS